MSDFVRNMNELSQKGDGGGNNQLIRDKLRFKQFLFMDKTIKTK